MTSEKHQCRHCGRELPQTALPGLCPPCMLKAGVTTEEAVGPGGTRVVCPVQEPPSEEEIARHFPQLEILECLGRGGMGVVYRARQPQLNRFVALKIVAPEKEQDPSFGERFTREAQALARLNHPNIVTVYDFGRADGLHYLLMEYVDGMSLRQLLQSSRLQAGQALAIIPKICEALQFAHEHGVVHRDIKPENVLIDKHGRVKIADFGIAKMVQGEGDQTNITQDQQVIGTPHYMAPEQVEKPHAVDHRADLYSLGVVFYEMLTGELPIGNFSPPSRKVEIDVRLDEVVLRALEKEPDRRYQQAEHLKTDVESVSAGNRSERATGSAIRVGRYAYLALGFFTAGTLGTLALMTLSRRDDMSLLFGGVALILALLFGCFGWQRRMGRNIAMATIVLFAACGVTAAIMSEAIPIPFVSEQRRAAAEAERRQRLKTINLAVAKLSPSNSVPPVVISTAPPSGATEIDAGPSEIRVTFSKAMRPGSWSWISLSPETTPGLAGAPHYLEDGRTCVLPVRLQPGRTYALWINSTDASNFTDLQGSPAVPYLLIFQTRATP